jgi:hypothetical protein
MADEAVDAEDEDAFHADGVRGRGARIVPRGLRCAFECSAARAASAERQRSVAEARANHGGRVVLAVDLERVDPQRAAAAADCDQRFGSRARASARRASTGAPAGAAASSTRVRRTRAGRPLTDVSAPG